MTFIDDGWQSEGSTAARDARPPGVGWPSAALPAPVEGRVDRRPARPRARSLAPREHGAYAQLALPLVVALATGRPGAAALGFAAAATALFLAHEPLLVLLGIRGGRARSESGGRARRRLAALAVVGLVAGAAAFGAAAPPARLAVGVPLAASLLLVPFVWRRRERSTAGELVAAAALAAAALPVAVAGGASIASAGAALGSWCCGFGAVTLAVRSIAAHKRQPAGGPGRAAVALPALAAAAGYLASGLVAWVAALPLLVAAGLVVALRPPAARLREVGWGLAGASALTAILLVAAG